MALGRPPICDSNHICAVNQPGFDPAEAFSRHGIGLVSMSERLPLLNGELSIQSKPESGIKKAKPPIVSHGFCLICHAYFYS